ncbi:hypothetical protein G3446_00625 [Thiorhodococcus minor]|uniref:MPN domain-containing protein n=1 Tax=Thiorhodococcus minor TaxID=57489 RepID=A0A6M0JSB5_9GAMM|nr:hypothetical protein [Thiorhodococcus minor]
MLRLGTLEHEVFGVVWLDHKHRVLAIEELFRGTLDGAAVHPREVVKRALKVNAGACLIWHNHPSGISEPSPSDRLLTQRLKDALSLVEVRVLDHIIVGETCTSLAEEGILWPRINGDCILACRRRVFPPKPSPFCADNSHSGLSAFSFERQVVGLRRTAPGDAQPIAETCRSVIRLSLCARRARVVPTWVDDIVGCPVRPVELEVAGGRRQPLTSVDL